MNDVEFIPHVASHHATITPNSYFIREHPSFSLLKSRMCVLLLFDCAGDSVRRIVGGDPTKAAQLNWRYLDVNGFMRTWKDASLVLT